jgi:NTE family protein
MRIPADARDPAVPQELADGVRDPIVLTDGEVYDDLGLEPVIMRCTEMLVSDGGGYVGHPARIPVDRLRHCNRCPGSSTTRYAACGRGCRSWGTATVTTAAPTGASAPRPATTGCSTPFPAARAREPAAIPTRLARFLGADIEDLIRWGRVVSDTTMRRWVVGPPVAPPAPGAAGGAAFGPP